MALKTVVTCLAIVVGVAWSATTMNLVKKKESLERFFLGNLDIQAFTNAAMPTEPPVAESILAQVSNMTIAESGRLVIMKHDTITLPDPRDVMGLNDTEIDNLINTTPAQKNARVVYNLKQSFDAFTVFMERMTQIVDAHLVKNKGKFDNEYSYLIKVINERLWQNSLIMHRLNMERLGRNINDLRMKINGGTDITDEDITRLRSDAASVLTSHKKCRIRMLELLNPVY